MILDSYNVIVAQKHFAHAHAPLNCVDVMLLPEVKKQFFSATWNANLCEKDITGSCRTAKHI